MDENNFSNQPFGDGQQNGFDNPPSQNGHDSTQQNSVNLAKQNDYQGGFDSTQQNSYQGGFDSTQQNSYQGGYDSAQQNGYQQQFQSGNYNTASQGQYQQPQQTYAPQGDTAPVMSLGEWVVTIILQMIPCVNIIMLFVWAFGNCNPSKKNFARAYLIITLVTFVLSIIFVAVAGISFATVAQNVSDSYY